MYDNKLLVKSEDIDALDNIIKIIENFSKKILIRNWKTQIEKIWSLYSKLKSSKNKNEKFIENYFKKIINRLHSILKREVKNNIYYIVGGHGGIIINDTGYCEFDFPGFALDKLLEKLKFAAQNQFPYNIEIATCCMEWLSHKYPEKFEELMNLFQKGKFEIINSTYSQPYLSLIGNESNIKQFELGKNVLEKLKIDVSIYYCSEASLHPQIPQILKNFDINYGSLRTRLMGACPSAISPCIKWKGLDGTTIKTLTDQPGIFNGEFWHGGFYLEIPNLLFQATARPFLNNVVFSSLEDFIMPLPLEKEVWRISKYSSIFGEFFLCSDLCDTLEENGEFQYKRDEFLLADYVFLPSKLFLFNKKAEYSILTAEFINYVLGIFDQKSCDNFLAKQWKELLITQAHDCYAVPFLRPGDYSSYQEIKEIEKLNYQSTILNKKQTILELSCSILEKIMKKNDEFINKALKKLFKILVRPIKQVSNNEITTILIINPTPYYRRDIISINLERKNNSSKFLLGKRASYKAIHLGSTLKSMVEIPGFSYETFMLTENEPDNLVEFEDFYYKFEINQENDGLNVYFKNSLIYTLQFYSKSKCKLEIIEQMENEIESTLKIKGTTLTKNFDLTLIQFRNVKRIEFFLNSINLSEISFVPSFNPEKILINYPFGIEETNRKKIQALDYLILKGNDISIMYLQRNSQRFKINKESNVFKNLLGTSGQYEFSILILENDNEDFINSEIAKYNLKLISYVNKSNFMNELNSEAFISIDPPIEVINIWRRGTESYMRIFNSTGKKIAISIKGKQVKEELKKVDFNYNVISSLNSNKIEILPWEIITIKL